MTQKIQELTLELLQEIQKNEGLDPAIKQGLENLVGESSANKAAGSIEAPSKEVMPKAPTATNEDGILALAEKLNLKAQYVRRLNTLRHYGMIGEEGEFNVDKLPTPSYEQVLNSFTQNELEVASAFSRPMLLIIPESSLEFKVKVISASKEEVLKHETYINEHYKTTDTGPDKITGWRAVIVEGTPEITPFKDDDVNTKFDERIKQRKTNRSSIEKGMDRHKYCILMMEAVRDGEPIDKKLFTILDDDPALSNENVPAADFDPNNNWIRFNWRFPDDVNVCARFRPSVGGDKML